jgi:Lipase (class 3)
VVVTDGAIALLLVDLYSGAYASFDHLEPGNGPSGICWATKRVDGVTYIFLRGSVTFWDWFKDFISLAAPCTHDVLGPVHPGFALGMDRVYAAIKQHSEGPWVVAGHSLGAGRAAILTGLMVEDGRTPLARVVFGEPKPGFSQLSRYIARVPGRSYRNGDTHQHDLVTDVPITLLIAEYEHPTPLIEVLAEPAIDAKEGVFKWHNMGLYAKAVQGIL